MPHNEASHAFSVKATTKDVSLLGVFVLDSFTAFSDLLVTYTEFTHSQLVMVLNSYCKTISYYFFQTIRNGF